MDYTIVLLACNSNTILLIVRYCDRPEQSIHCEKVTAAELECENGIRQSKKIGINIQSHLIPMNVILPNFLYNIAVV